MILNRRMEAASSLKAKRVFAITGAAAHPAITWEQPRAPGASESGARGPRPSGGSPVSWARPYIRPPDTISVGMARAIPNGGADGTSRMPFTGRTTREGGAGGLRPCPRSRTAVRRPCHMAARAGLILPRRTHLRSGPGPVRRNMCAGRRPR
jgi:hypothetical protein